MSLAGRVALVTGGGRGIGRAISIGLAQDGAAVAVNYTRDEEAAQATVDAIAALGGRAKAYRASVESFDDDRAMVEAVLADFGKIDILINNAGILSVETLDNMDFGAVLEQFKVNALGALRVTHALLGSLGEGSRIINMTSRMGSLDDNTSGGYYGYRMSKAALNMATRSLAVDLKSRGIIVVAMHPGIVQTDMTRGFGMLTAAESVAGMNEVIAGLSLDQTGLFLHYQGTTLPW